jgi:NTP pyrophosphatase (non-canonical NTP hydrolase)
MMNIREIQAVSTERSIRWHNGSIEQWSIMEWACAMCGEAGEAANVAKKIRRHDQEVYNGQSTKFNPLDRSSLRFKLAQELADTVLYAMLVAERENIDLHGAIVQTFNDKSEQAGFPERIS